MKNIIIISLIFLNCISFSKANILDSSETSIVKEKISISGIEKGLIEKEILLSSQGLTFQDSSARSYKILGFKLSIYIKNSNFIELDTNNGKLSAEMISALKPAPPGSKLFFEYIRCIDSAGVNRFVLPTQFILN